MNDPFDPNGKNVKCYMRDGVIWMRAVQNVPRGGELFMQYGWEYWKHNMRFLNADDRKKCLNAYPELKYIFK